MGLAVWFSDFCSALKVKDNGTIAVRYKAITRRLNIDYWNTTSDAAHSLYVGSYGRNTAVTGFSDLDMVMELPSRLYFQYDDYLGNGQSALLQAVRNSMARTYSTSYVGGDGQIVKVGFKDGITFEVVPVFINKSDTYTHPDANAGGRWKTTNPRPEIQAIRTRNSLCGNNLVQLCRMMRAWKRTWDVPIGGLLIDALAYQFINEFEHRSKSYLYYDFMCRDFFKWMSKQPSDKVYWRAPGSGQPVYGKGLFQYKAKRCYNLATQAIDHEMAEPKREWSAKQKWRQIFGNRFQA